MPERLKILHLEDSGIDAEIARDVLESNGIVCDLTRIDSREAFEAAIKQGGFDLILSDYCLPAFDGITALEMARRIRPETPFILLSGTLGEELAVESLKSGATDYVIKDRLGRLPTAVRRALREATEQTELKEALGRLRESEERFRELADQSSEGFWFVTLNPERVDYVSPAVEKLWGVSLQEFQEEPRRWTRSIHPEDLGHVTEKWTALLEGRSEKYECEYRVMRPDNSIRWVFVSGTPIRDEAKQLVRISGIAQDITQRRQLDQQQLRTQRLESIGTLAGGVAHDLNNSLAPILMATELLRLQFPETAASYIQLIQSSATRAAEMVKQLLTFAKGTDGERRPLSSARLLKEIERFVRSTFLKSIDLQVSCPENIWKITGDATQLHQVLLNLCVNARDAMPAGGRLTLTAENMVLDEAFATFVQDAKPGRYVVWKVRDTGTGIPAEILDKIFEPFFTTKGADKGTGLGLSTVIGIVKSHAGFLQVESVPRQGTTFSIYLPAADPHGRDTDQAPQIRTAFRGNQECVLVVDDEPPVRKVTRDLLTEMNFKVNTATDGTDALIQVAAGRADLRVVVTDLHMPNLNGVDFIRALKQMAPKLFVIAVSGRLEEQEIVELTQLGVTQILHKPFTQEQLADAMSKAVAKIAQ